MVGRPHRREAISPILRGWFERQPQHNSPHVLKPVYATKTSDCKIPNPLTQTNQPTIVNIVIVSGAVVAFVAAVNVVAIVHVATSTD